MIRKGTVYEEVVKKRFRKGVGLVWAHRFVGEVYVNGRRHRCRSTRRDKAEAFVRDWCEKSGDIVTRNFLNESQKDFIRLNYKKMSNRAIANAVGCSMSSVVKYGKEQD